MEKINTYESLQKEFILNNCGVSIIKEFESDLSQYRLQLKNIENESFLSFDDFVVKYNININDFIDLKESNVGKEPLLEIYKTYKFLYSKFNNSKNDLESINISIDIFMEKIIERLVKQIIEAGESERILKNGTVVGLSKFSSNGFEFIEVPYYAFACTNVSLDEVMINDNKGNLLSLRDIDSKLGSKNSKGEFFLPNSLGVSVCMSSYNEKGEIIFISQERNNAKVLSQNSNKYISSASGGISIDGLVDNGNALKIAIDQEIEEELGCTPIQLNNDEVTKSVTEEVYSIINKNDVSKGVFGVQTLLNNALLSRITSELGGLPSGVVSIGLVFEEARRNPEIIFISNINKDINYIKSKWEEAVDRDESLSIKGISLNEIEIDLDRRKKGLEPTIDNHFYMSYLGFLIKGERMK